MGGSQPQYDLTKKRKATSTFTFRAVVSGYLLYLGWQLISGAGGTDSSIPTWAAQLIGGVFAAAAVGFIVYSYKNYRVDLKAAELPESTGEEEE